jgi:hypothetical protein
VRSWTQDFRAVVDIDSMNRRVFHRVDVKANGELLWATKSRMGRVKTHREYITTINVSVDGAKIALKGRHDFPVHSRGRIKLGIEFCEVEVLDIEAARDATILRVNFVSPTQRFVSVVEKWMPISTDERNGFLSAWT